MYTNFAGSIKNGEIGNATIVTIPAVIGTDTAGPAMSYIIHAGSSSRAPSPATGTIHDNYISTVSAYGAFYP